MKTQWKGNHWAEKVNEKKSFFAFAAFLIYIKKFFISSKKNTTVSSRPSGISPSKS